MVRDNTERLRPPRFLWVPFELGRPFGAPGEPAFQTRVLRDVLGLLERDGPPPLLEEFPDDAPSSGTYLTGWTCPIPLPKPTQTDNSLLLVSVLAEINGLAPWHLMALKIRGRTTTGVLGIPIEEVASFLYAAMDSIPDSPKEGIPVGEAFRHACEELKSFYLEAATAKPRAASSFELANWFWGKTAAGQLLLALHRVAIGSADEGIRMVGETQLIPRSQIHRLS